MLYQIEQFVLGGGRLIAYLDPFAEMDQGDPNDPMARMQIGSASSLGMLLELWAEAVLETVATVPAAPASAVIPALLMKVLLFSPTIFDIAVPLFAIELIMEPSKWQNFLC